MQEIAEAVLHRLLEKCLAIRKPYVSIVLTEQEKPIAFEILNELIVEGYVSGFNPKMDSILTCDLTSKALDHIDTDRQMVVYPPK